MQELKAVVAAVACLTATLSACAREPDPAVARAPAHTGPIDASGSPRNCLRQPAGAASTLRCWVEWLAAPALAGREPGSPGGATAREGLEAVLRDLSLEPGGSAGSYTQALSRGANVLAKIVGDDPARSGEHVVFGAHYDHLGVRGGATYLGADDNASGVAVLLEVTRRLVADPPARSVLVAAFDAEEPPAYLGEAMGSIHFVAHPTVPREQIVAMVTMDLMGGNLWAGGRTPLYVMGRETIASAGAPALDAQVVPTRAMHLRLVEDLPGGRQAFSDHGAFFAVQIPVLLFSTGRSPHYHRVTDLPDTLDYDKLAGEVEIVEAHLRWLADLPERPAWRADPPVTAADADTLADLLASASGSGGSPEFAGMPTPVIRDDLARLRRLSTGAPTTTALAEADARAVITISLRAQCLLAPDDEAPTATCLML